MGLFDDVMDFVNDMNAIKSDAVGLGQDVIKELTSEADDVKQTIADTATELKSQAEDVSATIKKTASLQDAPSDVSTNELAE